MSRVDERIEALREELQACQGYGTGNRYSDELKSRVLELMGDLRDSGISQRVACARLGLRTWRIGLWQQARVAKPSAGQLVPVQVLPTVRHQAEPRRAQPCLSVEGPHGLRIEGLDVESLAELIRRLA
jgi:transposase-like protein